ncbi:pilus assembly protein [Vibrio coralliilyticus]|uniref:TadE/TadG family type IV pilus assembly protein n=1 Tax=Vibrio coralliilyticus TaxID=190893 RepID=UPI00148C5301|nr:TadE family protein [Vibrio coralliilyticus]NOH53535.1 pilus assembly protein [Vibrio coralliilyticus]
MVIKKQSGSQTIEFAMVIVPLLIVFLAVFELTRFLWTGFILDSAVASSAREVRVLTASSDVLNKMKNVIAGFPLLKSESITVTATKYADSVESLANNNMTSVSNAVLAEYQISYQFSFVVVPYLAEQFPSVSELKRTVLVSYDA